MKTNENVTRRNFARDFMLFVLFAREALISGEGQPETLGKRPKTEKILRYAN